MWDPEACVRSAVPYSRDRETQTSVPVILKGPQLNSEGIIDLYRILSAREKKNTELTKLQTGTPFSCLPPLLFSFLLSIYWMTSKRVELKKFSLKIKYLEQDLSHCKHLIIIVMANRYHIFFYVSSFVLGVKNAAEEDTHGPCPHETCIHKSWVSSYLGFYPPWRAKRVMLHPNV